MQQRSSSLRSAVLDDESRKEPTENEICTLIGTVLRVDTSNSLTDERLMYGCDRPGSVLSGHRDRKSMSNPSIRSFPIPEQHAEVLRDQFTFAETIVADDDVQDVQFVQSSSQQRVDSRENR